MNIANINLDDEVLIIAEIGNNHLGSLELAFEHILQAKESGADIAKFQLIIADNVVSKRQQSYKHVQNHLMETQHDRWSRISFNYKQMEQVKAYCDLVGIEFMCTPFCLESLDWVAENCNRIKIASSDSTWEKFVVSAKLKGKQVLISTGVMTLDELDSISYNLDEQDVIMHCVSEYPVNTDSAHLGKIDFLRNNYDMHVGYSDHTQGMHASMIAATKGVYCIEKHFIVSNKIPAGDRMVSSTPLEISDFSQYLDCLDNNPAGHWRESDIVNKELFERSIYAKSELCAGSIVRESDLVMLRPFENEGFGSNEVKDVIGRELLADIKAGQLIIDEHLKSRTPQ